MFLENITAMVRVRGIYSTGLVHMTWGPWEQNLVEGQLWGLGKSS